MTGLPTDTRNALVQVYADALDGGYLEVRSGDAPDPDAGATGTLLATLTLNSPAFGSPASGAISAITSPTVEANGDATGAVGWLRAYTSTDAPVIDANLAELDLSTSTVTEGQPVTLLGWTITQSDGS